MDITVVWKEKSGKTELDISGSFSGWAGFIGKAGMYRKIAGFQIPFLSFLIKKRAPWAKALLRIQLIKKRTGDNNQQNEENQNSTRASKQAVTSTAVTHFYPTPFH